MDNRVCHCILNDFVVAFRIGTEQTVSMIFREGEDVAVVYVGSISCSIALECAGSPDDHECSPPVPWMSSKCVVLFMKVVFSELCGPRRSGVAAESIMSRCCSVGGFSSSQDAARITVCESKAPGVSAIL